MKFDIFVLPFTIGLAFVIGYMILRTVKWIIFLNTNDQLKLIKGIFSLKVFGVIYEIISESLLHRRIFKVNRRLGYMHMSLAFGWFLLIVIGNFESRYYSDIPVNPPYYPIFFKFFHHYKATTLMGMIYTFLLDLVLIFILSGLVLAIIKRFRPAKYGMKRTTVQQSFDRFALAALWLIFPLRLLAESFTAGLYNHGGFLTNSLGWVFSWFLPLETLSYTAWWAYSLSLFVFFISVPFSRYMHIPSEIVLIALRRFGIASQHKKGSFSDLEIHSCSRCGICIDKCQVVNDANIAGTASVYFLFSVHENCVEDQVLFNCLQCGRCAAFCPVKIDTDGIRLGERIFRHNEKNASFDYISPTEKRKAATIYFSGCMSHLTPTVPLAVMQLAKKAGVDILHLDKDGSVCCGRPLMFSGRVDEAKILMEKNIALIKQTGAKTMVTSCPICYKTFKEDYHLDIEVLHHSVFLNRLLQANRLIPAHTGKKLVYHDPCELGRGSEIYEEPRLLLSRFSYLQNIESEKETSLCCGGSLGNYSLNHEKRQLISYAAVEKLTETGANEIVTACPLCKKTLQGATQKKVADISEYLLMAVETYEKQQHAFLKAAETASISQNH